MGKSKVAAALINDCSVDPILGLSRGVYINTDDIDLASLTFTKSRVTGFALKAGTTGYEISWLKRMGNSNNNLVASPTEREGFTHAFAAQLGEASADNADTLKDMLCSCGGIIIAESNFKGTDQLDAFKIFGLTSGLHLSETIYSSNENQGAITYILSTQGGDKEKYVFNTLAVGDYPTMSALMETFFAQA